MRFKINCISKSLLLITFIQLVSWSSTAQLAQKSEVGIGLGTFNYTGDLSRNYHFAFSKPAATLFYRSNLSHVISLRTSLTGGKLGASDLKHPIDAFATKRASSFSIFLMEASAVFEYHFLDWKEPKKKLRFTPYVFGGFAMFVMSGTQTKTAAYSNVQPTIPFGGGVKYILNPKYYLSMEFGVRRTMFDYLDNISDGNPRFKNYHYGNRYDNDAYYFLGISITRTFYDIPCPTSPYR